MMSQMWRSVNLIEQPHAAVMLTYRAVRVELFAARTLPST